MAEHKAIIDWKNNGPDFLKGRFTREHTWTFDGGQCVTASAASSVVPPPLSNPEGIDPEEAFVASLSSCHMLTFLFLAYRQGYQVESYHDEAVATMAKGENGVPWVSLITLNPKVTYCGDKQPAAGDESKLHDQAHHYCYIANSIKTKMVVAGLDSA